MGQDCESIHSLPKGTLAKHLFASIESNPAARAAILLTALVSICTYRQRPIQYQALFSLRGFAIRCLQTAMSDPETCHSGSTAMAIVSLGNFERYLGREDVHQTHIQGLASWRHAHGGSVDWALDRVLLWMETVEDDDISRNASVILECLPIET
jgi:hypothetical protein